MTKLFSTLTLTLMILAVGACSTSSKKVDKNGYVKHKSGSFQLKPFKEVQLENGLKIFFIQDETLPRVSMTLLVKTGSLQENANQAGLNALTAYMLEQGTQTRDAMKLADEFGQIATNLDISPSYDSTTVYADALSNSKGTLLDLFVDVVMNPAFKDAEIGRIRSQMLANIKKKVDNPSSFASEKMDDFIFGQHPYGRDAMGTAESLRSLTKQNLIKHFLSYYRPNNSTLAIVGSYNSEFESQVKTAFAKWTRRNIPELKIEPSKAGDSLQVRALLKKNLQQTQIRIGQLGIPRNNPDYLTLRLANEVLGGSFASRLNQKVRDDLGLTYSIYSGFDTKLLQGSFDISTFTKNESVGKTIEETLKVVTDYVAQGATEKEVAAAKNQLIGQFPRAIETPDRLAYNLLALDFYGIPVTYLTDYNSNVSKISVKEVNDVIKKYINPGTLKVLVYGDEKVLPQIKSFKPEVVKM